MKYGDLISVIIPSFNRETQLVRAIRGVLGQSYSNIELIIVDDASTDNSCSVVEAIDDPRLKLVKHMINQGASASRNTGIDAAEGDLIAFQDSDDNWFPEKLEVQMRHFCELPDDYVAVFCMKIIYGRSIDLKGRKTYGARHVSCVPGPKETIKDGDLSDAFLWGNFMGPPTVLLKKSSFYAAGGFDLRLKNNNDWDFNLRLSRIGKIGFINEPLLIVYDSEDGISKNPVSKAFSTIVIFGKIKRYKPMSKSLAATALSVHRHLVLKNKPRAARKFLLKSIDLEPLRIGLYIRFALSFLPIFYKDLLTTQRKKRTKY